MKTIKRVYAETFANVDLNDERNMDNMPSFKTLKYSLYLSRSKRIPRIPHTREDVHLDGEWTETLDGRNFVLVNDGDAERMIIFATQQNVRLLCDVDALFMDGTFKMAPEMFHQVYSYI